MAVACFKIRMMILAVGHEAHRVDEAQRAVEVVESEVLDDALVVFLGRPSRQLGEQLIDLLWFQTVCFRISWMAVLCG